MPKLKMFYVLQLPLLKLAEPSIDILVFFFEESQCIFVLLEIFLLFTQSFMNACINIFYLCAVTVNLISKFLQKRVIDIYHMF
jgi:hypothetical protein